MYPNIDNRAPPPEPNQKNTPYTRWLSWIMSSSSSTSVTNGAVKLGKILDGEEILTSQDQIEVEVDGDDRDEEEVKDGYCVECEGGRRHSVHSLTDI
jgi:translation elongation factor EF-1alpha